MSTETHISHKKTKTELPLSLIESEILPRLPAKSACHCKCVCKRWNSFLSTSTFARMHLHHVTIKNYKLLLLDVKKPVTFRSIDCESLNQNCPPTIDSNPLANPDPSSVSVIRASLDGLVCLASRNLPRKLAFWNPLTGVYKKLSPNPSVRSTNKTCSDVIGFYIDSSNDYKLLYMINRGNRGAWIYSHGSDSWRQIKFLDDRNLVFRDRLMPATSYNQRLYFIATDLANHSWIICFDVRTETFRKIRCPTFPSGASYYYVRLVVLNGCIHLCVAYSIYTHPNRSLDYDGMWRMDGDGWVKVRSFKDRGYNKFRMMNIYSTTMINGDWLAVLEGNYWFRKVESRNDFARHCWHFCTQSKAHNLSRMIYVESLMSP